MDLVRSAALYTRTGLNALPRNGLLAWWNAEGDVCGDTSLLTAASDGGAVAGWRDSGPYGYHVTQSTGSSQPKYRKSVAALGGRPGIEFDGGDTLSRFIGSPVLANLTTYTIYVVFVTSSASSNHYMFSENNATVNNPVIGARMATGTYTMFARDDAGINIFPSSGAANNGNVHVLAIRRTASDSWQVRGDGAQQAVSSTSIGTTSTDTFNIGSTRVGSSAFTGTIAQILLYADDNYQQVEPILMKYYGIGQGLNALPGTGLLAHWNAERSVYSDTALTTAIDDGGTVAGWGDLGSSAYHVTQSTVGNRPLYRASVTAFGGRPGVEFVSSDVLSRTLSSPILGNLTTYNVFVVYATSSAASNVYPFAEDSSSAANPVVGARITSGAYGATHRDDAGSIQLAGGGTGGANGAVHLLTLRRTAAASFSTRGDGTQVGTSSTSISTTTTNRVNIGAFLSATTYYVGYVAQVLLYSGDVFATVEPILRAYYRI